MLFFKFKVFCSWVFTEERIESSQPSIKHSLVECCSDICPSVGFFPIFTYDHGAQLEWYQLLGHHSNQSLHPSISQFGQEAISRKSSCCSKTSSIMLLWTFYAAEFFLFWFDAILSLSSTCHINCSKTYTLQIQVQLCLKQRNIQVNSPRTFQQR